jgi:hypothetical protein
MKNRLTVLVGVVLWVAGLVPGWVGSTQGFIGHITEDPTKILQKYLSLDKKGARLEAYSWEVIRPFVAWKEEPVWGHLVVISQYEIEDDISQWEILNTLEANIPVVFEILGTLYWESATFVAEPHRKTVFFHIKAVQDRWQIAGPQLPPHVGRQRIIDFVQWTELNEPNPEKKSVFVSLEKELESVSEKDVQQ